MTLDSDILEKDVYTKRNSRDTEKADEDYHKLH